MPNGTANGTARRNFLAGAAGLALAGTAKGTASAQTGAQTGAPALPDRAVTLNIMDVGGALALVQKPIENYRRAKSNLVSRITFSKAPAPELAGKLRAQQQAGRVDIDLVLGGVDALAAGLDQKLWVELLPRYADALPKPEDIYLPPALEMHKLGLGQAMCMVYYPSGPLLEYMPDKVPQPPTSAEELLAWTRANKNRFFYARPANSGPGRTFLMGLPYLLGDKNPKDPVNGWEKTWAYLKALDENVEYYPSGTAATMKELGEGSRDMIVSTTGWDINPRALGIVPKEAKITTLKGFHWVVDAQYMAVPKGVPDNKLAVLLDLMRWVLTPEQNAYAYDEGYFYPGPAVKGATLAMAPEESRKVIAEFGRPEYEKLIADNPTEIPLLPDQVVLAFRRWDEQIGGSKGR